MLFHDINSVTLCNVLSLDTCCFKLKRQFKCVWTYKRNIKVQLLFVNNAFTQLLNMSFKHVCVLWYCILIENNQNQLKTLWTSMLTDYITFYIWEIMRWWDIWNTWVLHVKSKVKFLPFTNLCTPKFYCTPNSLEQHYACNQN